ncbi:hypothetical protein LPJ61_004531 [Coemansia biformis]|uniref:PAS domain-containing protein n=1 Tax=Coemansia biformis TaxID=1286918 RepID=A0A9W7YAH6_9FUNG|nr:hypothetical protein LPJ61_004531 [Coemansia biformis]
MLIDEHDEIVSADAEAVEALRGPLEEWDDSGEVHVLRDGSCSGRLHKYWAFIERLEVGSSSNSSSASAHHYLVIRRSEDDAVVWMQVCIHAVEPRDGRSLYMWNVHDISGSARCLEMSRMPADQEYELSLESDGMPHSPLLTQSPDARPSSDPQPRTQLAGLLAGAVASEEFAVLHLTGFGAVDAVFPRRLLGWDEADILDRSFVGLLCPEDRAFFCSALRRCYHDGIPQRLALKIAPAMLPSNADATLHKGNGDELPPRDYVACDVTVLLPESVQQPVLVVRASDSQWRRRGACLSDSQTRSTDSLRHAVSRMQMDSVHVQAAGSPPVSLGQVREATQGAAAGCTQPHPDPTPTSVNLGEAATLVPGCVARSTLPLVAKAATGDVSATQSGGDRQPKAPLSLAGATMAIPMCDIFTVAARQPLSSAMAASKQPALPLACNSSETVLGRFSSIGSTLASVLERAGNHIAHTQSLCAAIGGAADDHKRM